MARTDPDRAPPGGPAGVPDLELGPRPSPKAVAAPAKKATPPAPAPRWDDEEDDEPSLELADDPRLRRAPAPAPVVVAPAPPADQETPPDPPPGDPGLARTMVDVSPPKVRLGPRRDDPAVLLASYPPSPRRIWQTPEYAAKVLLRRRMLKRSHAAHARASLPDTPVYERALHVHDARALYTGIAVSVLVVSVAGLLYLSPVILRFARLLAQD